MPFIQEVDDCEMAVEGSECWTDRSCGKSGYQLLEANNALDWEIVSIKL